jgi:hypothetical protein
LNKKNAPKDDGPCSLDELLNDDDDFGEDPQLDLNDFVKVFALGFFTAVVWLGGPYLIEKLKVLLAHAVMLQRFL